MVDAAHEWGFQKYSEFEAMNDQDKAVVMAYTKAIKTMRGVEAQEQARLAARNTGNNKPGRKSRGSR